MKSTTRFPLLLCCLLSCAEALGQIGNFGGNPSSIRWQQINTDTLRIIFPEGMEKAAQRVASVSHHLQKNYNSTIGRKVWKSNIILQNNTTISNAYVGLPPYKSEFYLMPMQDAVTMGATNWVDQLSLHEYRHVQQYSNFNHGFTKLLSILMGQSGRALGSALAVPDWFYEGDAVYNETMLSKQGRGRLPSFFSEYKALHYEKKKYNYSQLLNGSMNNLIPNNYHLGYMLVAYGREMYGNDFWKNIDKKGTRYIAIIGKNTAKKQSISKKQFFDNALNYYQQQWNNDSSLGRIEWLTPPRRNEVVNYKYPYLMKDGAVVVLKESYKEISAFYSIQKDGVEKKIAGREIAMDNYYSYNSGKIIYTVYEADNRWDNRDFSNIKILDVHTNSCKTITSKGKYFSPDISHTGDKIVAIEMLPDQSSSIVMMNADGSNKSVLQKSYDTVYSYPKFSADDKSLYVYMRSRNGEMEIAQCGLALSDNQSSTGLPINRIVGGTQLIGYPVVQGDTLIYTCVNEGRDEVWAYVAGKTYQLAAYRSSLYQSVIADDGNLITTAVTSNGHRIGKMNALWQPATMPDTLKALYVTRPFNLVDNNTLLNVENRFFPVSRYAKTHGLFNFHSWYPLNIGNNQAFFALYGENVLSSLQSQLYIGSHINERDFKIGYTGIYGGWYLQPLIDVNYTWGRGLSVLELPYQSNNWNELNIAAGLRLPLNFSQGKYFRHLTLSGTYNTLNRYGGDVKRVFRKNNLNYLESGIQFSNRLPKAKQHIYAHWAQSLLLQYKNTVGQKPTAQEFLASGSVYLPGLARTHSLVVTGAYLARDTNNAYYFYGNFPMSHGYDALDYPRMWKWGVNYHFPLCYPNAGALGIFFQRIRANVFYDCTKVKNLQYNEIYEYSSVGGALYFDTKILAIAPFSFGIRYSKLLNTYSVGQEKDRWEFVVPVDLF